MTIDDILEKLELEYLETDLDALSPKDRMSFWLQVKEFRSAKLQRLPFEPLGDDEVQIKIVYEDNRTKPHKGISEPVEQPKKG